MPAQGRDFYAILGVDRNADDAQLKRSYKKAAIKYHPDKHASKSDAEKTQAEEKFKEVAEAFETLSDKDKRAVYDRYGEEGLKVGGGRSPAGDMSSGFRTSGVPAGFAGGFPGGGVSFSFGASGSGASGMDTARAEAIFRQMFSSMDGFGSIGGFGGSPSRMHSNMRSDSPVADDPFSDLVGGMLGSSTISRAGGAGGTRGARRPRSNRLDMLPTGAFVQLHGLSDPTRNGAIGRIERYDENTQRYIIALDNTCSQSVAIRPANVMQVVQQARVVGTSQSALNDKIISAATYDKSSKRYKCEGLKADGTVLALKPENVILPQDCRVTVESVKSRPALNGQVGSIIGVENERYVVQIADEAVRLRFGAVAAA
mmetsp:Transcript_7229/g.18886  ORF Transcript_7229/g.18886 Transcript_7229/m.18886 type:complete len:371 (+) Transcript_7229:117-1229(+)|eukprot:CAMPEP_0115847472 /NCGR_PEP_ID=MMETSP0287-20121206/10401_1 /TAXON_ID=412157 /ORGANISM="Chrysochromulina rotalis, Strain UIO044" /LENGTH=370 /DNA_ID=CAMNT_0003301309 /DNA_START=116 /DNA_END=1228 /DNA_ORIENTATION=+